MNELGESACGGLWSTTSQAGEAGKDGVGFLEADVGNVGAVPSVPTERRPPEPRGLVDQEQNQLERVREAHEVEFSSRSERDRGVAGVERAAEPAVG